MNPFLNEKTWWYLSRSSGIVAVVLLVMTVVWGVALATKFSKAIRPAWTLEVHKWLSGLAFCGVGLHLLGLYLDSYLEFGPKELLVPGASPYRPLAVALGVLTLYGMVAVQITSLARRHLSRRTWHMIHLSSYLVVWGGLMHAGLAGTDTTNGFYQLLAAAMILMTAAVVVLRLLAPKRRSSRTPSHPTAGGQPNSLTTAAVRAPAMAASTPAGGRGCNPSGVANDPRSQHPAAPRGPAQASRRPAVPRTEAAPWIDPLLAPPRRGKSPSGSDRRRGNPY